MSRTSICIRNPNRSDGFTISDVPLDASVQQLQQIISEQYPGHPAPADQTIVFAGKVLKDMRATIRSLVEKHDPISGPHNFHLVIKSPQSPSPPPPASRPAPPAAPTPAPTSSASGTETSSAPAAASEPAAGTAAGAPAEATTPHAEAHDSAQAAGNMQDPFSMGYIPPMYFNPVLSSAYQAAYFAALAAGISTQQQQQLQQAQAGTSASTSEPSTSTGALAAPFSMVPPMYNPAMMQAYMAAMSSMNPGGMNVQQQQLLRAAQGQAMGMPPYMQMMGGYPNPGQMVMVLQQGVAGTGQQGATGAAAAGLRRRNAAGAAMAQAAAQAQAARALRRPRVFTIRISMRFLLQILVFGMILWQHFTWHRFFALLLIGCALWITSRPSLRRYLAGMQAQAQRPHAAVAGGQAAAAAVPFAGAPGQPGDAAAAAGEPAVGDAAAAPAAPPAAAAPPNRGFLGEIAMILLGFITSLLPTYNHNPEDAAAFAVAQELAAQDAAAAPQGGAAGAAAAGGPPQRRNQEEDEAGRAGGAAGGAAAAQPPAAAGVAAQAAPHAHE